MKKGFRRVLAATSAAFLTGVLALLASPVQASSVDQRIETLEKELARLKQEQSEAKAQAVAAEKKIPLFIYRPSNGLTIAAADDRWEIQIGDRLTVYWTFWTRGGDGTSIPKKGTTNGVLQVRRNRPYMNFRLMEGFYDLRFQMDVANGGSSNGGNFTAFDAEMYIHFENISPWLPYFAFGASPSTIVNPQDENCSSKRCGRAEQGLLTNGAGPGTGSMDRGMVWVWNKIPRLGPARITFLDVALGQDDIGTEQEFDQLSSSNITSDGRTFIGGLGVRPFDKLGGTVGSFLKGLEISFGTRVQETPRTTTGFRAWNIRTDQTRAERVSMIRTSSNGLAGTSYWYSPGVGWDWEWITLRFSGGFANARICDKAGNGGCSIGGMVRGSQFRAMGEFWLWSPKKGLLAGNSRDGGFMLSPLFNRTDVWGAGLTGSAPSSGRSNGRAAYALDTGIALWYFIPGNFMNVGVVWDHWACGNCNSDVNSVVPNGKPGDSYDWDTITLISRFQF